MIFDWNDKLFVRKCLLTNPQMVDDLARVFGYEHVMRLPERELYYWSGDSGEEELIRRRKLES